MQSFRPSLLVTSLVTCLVGCSSAADVGDPCTDTADCLGGLSCMVHEGAEVTPVCMSDCDITTTRLCEGGAVCTPAMGAGRPANLGVCYLGGTTAVGQACTGNLQCVRGSICVSTGGAQQCYRACTTTDGAGCEAGETCSALEGMGTNGFCVSGG